MALNSLVNYTHREKLTTFWQLGTCLLAPQISPIWVSQFVISDDNINTVLCRSGGIIIVRTVPPLPLIRRERIRSGSQVCVLWRITASAFDIQIHLFNIIELSSCAPSIAAGHDAVPEQVQRILWVNCCSFPCVRSISFTHCQRAIEESSFTPPTHPISHLRVLIVRGQKSFLSTGTSAFVFLQYDEHFVCLASWRMTWWLCHFFGSRRRLISGSTGIEATHTHHNILLYTTLSLIRYHHPGLCWRARSIFAG